MGLDQYLYQDIWVSGYRDEEADRLATIRKAAGVFVPDGVEFGSLTVKATVMYWRKANQVHKWFVDNVQGGVDDCGEYEVTRENLEELRDICGEILDKVSLIDGHVSNGYTFSQEGGLQDIYEPGLVIDKPEIAEKLLPNTEGFFFGSQGYDQWYLRDIEDTHKALTEILENTPEDTFWQYQSSW